MLGNEPFGSLHVPVRDRSNDFRYLMRRKVDFHDRTGFRNVDMKRRMIERVNPDLEPVLANECGH
jgi:hypothetical protein